MVVRRRIKPERISPRRRLDRAAGNNTGNAGVRPVEGDKLYTSLRLGRISGAMFAIAERLPRLFRSFPLKTDS
jgi:hypothetical protein